MLCYIITYTNFNIVFFHLIFLIKNEADYIAIKIITAETTIDGPEGVSKYKEL